MAFLCGYLLARHPYALKHGAHVRVVDVIYDRLNTRKQLMIDLIGTVFLLLPVSLIVVWAGWSFTAAAYQLGTQPSGLGEFFSMLVNQGIGERSQDPGGLLNRWIIKLVIPFSFFVLFLTGIAVAIEKLQAVRLAFASSAANTK